MTYIISFLILIITPSTLLASTEQMVCTTDMLSYVRSGPGPKNPVVGRLSKYTPLKVLEEKEGWVKVSTLNLEGWIFKKLVSAKIDCLYNLNNQKQVNCPGHPIERKFPVKYKETFQVLNSEIGCVSVKDAHGNTFKIVSENVWPKKFSQQITF